MLNNNQHNGNSNRTNNVAAVGQITIPALLLCTYPLRIYPEKNGYLKIFIL